MAFGDFASAINDAISGTIGLGFGIYDRYKQNEIDERNFNAQKDFTDWQKSFSESEAARQQSQYAEQSAFQREQYGYSKAFTREQYEYQKAQNLLTQQREDNAVQRRVADLKSAGLSPVLAAGSAASASPVHASSGSPSAGSVSSGSVAPSGQAPQRRYTPFDIMSLISASKDIAVKDKQLQLMQVQEEKVKADSIEADARTNGLVLANQRAAFENGLLSLRAYQYNQKWVKDMLSADQAMENMRSVIRANDAAASLHGMQFAEQLYNYNYYKNLGLPTNAPAEVKTAASVVGAAQPIVDKIIQSVTGMSVEPSTRKPAEFDPALARRYRAHEAWNKKRY